MKFCKNHNGVYELPKHPVLSFMLSVRYSGAVDSYVPCCSGDVIADRSPRIIDVVMLANKTGTATV